MGLNTKCQWPYINDCTWIAPTWKNWSDSYTYLYSAQAYKWVLDCRLWWQLESVDQTPKLLLWLYTPTERGGLYQSVAKTVNGNNINQSLLQQIGINQNTRVWLNMLIWLFLWNTNYKLSMFDVWARLNSWINWYLLLEWPIGKQYVDLILFYSKKREKNLMNITSVRHSY